VLIRARYVRTASCVVLHDPAAEGLATMPRSPAQQRLDTVTGGGWEGLALTKVLETLQAAGRSEPKEEGFGFSKATAVVREVCAGWQAVYDALVTRLVFKREMSDEAVGMVVRRFPAVVSVEFKFVAGGHVVTDMGVKAMSSIRALTSLNLTDCYNLTDEGLRAVSRLKSLTYLKLFNCFKVKNEGVLAVSGMPTLSYLGLIHCTKITNKGVRAVSTTTSLTSLNLYHCAKITDEAVRALSSLPALAHLDLRACGKVTAAGVQALRSTTVAPNLHIESDA